MSYIVLGTSKVKMLFLVILSLTLFSSIVVAEDSAITLEESLSSHHPVSDIPILIEIAGSESNLIKELIDLRSRQKPPALGINATKVLLKFTDNIDVQDALLSDVRSKDRMGLTSIILANIDSVEDSSFRKSLAVTAIDSSKDFNPAFKSRVKSLINSSSDSSLKSLIKE